MNRVVGRFQYHLWFNLKPHALEAAALTAAREFLSAQLAGGKIVAFRLVRNTVVPPDTRLPRYLALIDFNSRDHFSSAFSDLRREGIHKGSHGDLMRMISDFHIEFTELPDEP